eukprot:SAG31_NODE_1480_length_8180_cov_5.458978_8_plen_93_part_00
MHLHRSKEAILCERTLLVKSLGQATSLILHPCVTKFDVLHVLLNILSVLFVHQAVCIDTVYARLFKDRTKNNACAVEQAIWIAHCTSRILAQ